MPSWLYWINNRIKNFDMFGSIWFANLDCLVDNVKYLHDDGDEYQQPSEPYKPSESNESKLGDKSANHNCATSDCGICNGTRPNCYCNFPTHGKHGHYFGSHTAKHFDNSINEYNELYNKLSSTKYYDDVGYRESTRNTKG